MITPRLEDIILKGKGRWANWSWGAGNIGGIPIPDNNILVITGFHFFSCALKIREGGATGSDYVHFFRIESDKNSNDFVIKSPSAAGAVNKYYFDTYITAFSEVQLRL